jgi:hypothetical protein
MPAKAMTVSTANVIQIPGGTRAFSAVSRMAWMSMTSFSV